MEIVLPLGGVKRTHVLGTPSSVSSTSRNGPSSPKDARNCGRAGVSVPFNAVAASGGLKILMPSTGSEAGKASAINPDTRKLVLTLSAAREPQPKNCSAKLKQRYYAKIVTKIGGLILEQRPSTCKQLPFLAGER